MATAEILSALSDHGQIDAAFRLLNQEEYPSWRYAINRGATTMWEHWDSITPGGAPRDPSMNSFNHYAQGSFGHWMYRNIAGIRPDPEAPGFGHFVIRPVPGSGLTSGSGVFRSVRGVIAAEWKSHEQEFVLLVTIPVNATACVHVPCSPGSEIFEGGYPVREVKDLEFTGHASGYSVFRAGSGDYSFSVPR